MESLKCRALGCELSAMFKCEKNHEDMILCQIHHQAHLAECQYAEARRLKEQSMLIKLIHNLNVHDQDKENMRIVSLLGQAFFMRINTIYIRIPSDYYEALRGVSSVLVDKIQKIPNGHPEKILKKCQKFVKAIQKIIYNLEIDPNALNLELQQIYSEYHTTKQSIISSGLCKLLDTAERDLGFTQTAKKNLFYTIELQAVKENFIAKYFLMDKLDFKIISEDFKETFIPFITVPADLSRILDNFDVQFKNASLKNSNETRAKLSSAIIRTWETKEYMRVSLFAYKIPKENETLVDVNSDWKMLLCLVLIKSSSTLDSIIELSADELLISLRINTSTYLIYYQNNACCLSLILNSTNLKIASGSTSDSVMIYFHNTRTCEIYQLKESKLEKERFTDINLDNDEDITGLAYIPDLNKLIYSTTKTSISSWVIGEYRVKINLDVQNEAYVCLKYFPSKKLICLKTSGFLKIFSNYLQIVKDTDLIGDEMCLIDSPVGEMCMILRISSNLIEYQTKIQANLDDRRYSVRYKALANCTHCMSKDFSQPPPPGKNDPYQCFHCRKFLVPDWQLDFEVGLKI